MKDIIKTILVTIIGAVIFLSLFFYMFIGAVIQTSERLSPAQSEIYEGGAQ